MFVANYSDGVHTEKLCADGKVFNDYDSNEEKCDLPYNIDCTKRHKLRKYNKLFNNSLLSPFAVNRLKKKKKKHSACRFSYYH